MTKKKESITINVNVEDIQAGLRKLLRSEFAPLIAEIIIDNLATTEVGLDQLYLAFSGVKKQIKFNVLDQVYVKKSKCATWKMDEDAMKKADMIFKGAVRAEITEINPCKKDPIAIKYNIITSTGETEEYLHTRISPEDAVLNAVDFLESKDDDMPF